MVKGFGPNGGISLVEYVLSDLWPKIRSRIFTFILSGSFHKIGKGTRIGPRFRFCNINEMVLGEFVTIYADVWMSIRPGYSGPGPKIFIGDWAQIGQNATISAAKKVVIGNYVLFARNVYVSDHGHEFADVTRPIFLQGMRRVEEVSIGDNTWIGQNACIMPGVKIGKNCVIGANSVVCDDVPDYCIAAGIPARVIRRCDEKRKEEVARP